LQGLLNQLQELTLDDQPSSMGAQEYVHCKEEFDLNTLDFPTDEHFKVVCT
jgi:hypothetical protein